MIMTSHTLYIKLDENLDDDIVKYYKEYKPKHLDDSGFDLPAIMDYDIPNSRKEDGIINSTGIRFGISCCMINNNTDKLVGYYLYPRSSFHKYPLLVANHIGIIDAGYRGPITGMVKPLYPKIVKNDNHIYKITISKNTKLFQICAPDLSPFNIKIVENLPESSRGSSGFGSTGN